MIKETLVLHTDYNREVIFCSLKNAWDMTPRITCGLPLAVCNLYLNVVVDKNPTVPL